jgi:hypothetical protein
LPGLAVWEVIVQRGILFPKKLTLSNFICRSNIIHSSRYDYSLVEYKNNDTKVKIICSVHGIFLQTPCSHMRGTGCPKCFYSKKKPHRKYKIKPRHHQSPDIFIQKAKAVHGEFYDYSQVVYNNSKSKVIIICPEHGAFTQTPEKHWSGRGCPICGNLKKGNRLSKEEFIRKSQEIHGNRYDYSQVNYTRNCIRVKICCSLHGVFYQAPVCHLAGQGCPICGTITKSVKLIKSFESFVQDAIKIHGDNYIYEKFSYVNSKVKTLIKCKKHGTFWQSPNSHLHGQGCPKCHKQVSKWELELLEYVKTICPDAEGSKRNWFVGHKSKEIDIYIPSLKVGFECNGTYWHKIRTDYDCNDKVEEAKRQGIDLYILWDNVAIDKNKQFILKILNDRITRNSIII